MRTDAPSSTRATRARRFAGACGALVLSACGAAATPPQDVEYPRSNDVVCRYVGLESVETPQHEDTDSVTMLATYTFREKNVPPPAEPLSLKFQVDRSRVSELRSHLESQPEVICHPEPNARYKVQVKPLPEPHAELPE
jgi:hypothetical protein